MDAAVESLSATPSELGAARVATPPPTNARRRPRRRGAPRATRRSRRARARGRPAVIRLATPRGVWRVARALAPKRERRAGAASRVDADLGTSRRAPPRGGSRAGSGVGGGVARRDRRRRSRAIRSGTRERYPRRSRRRRERSRGKARETASSSRRGDVARLRIHRRRRRAAAGRVGGARGRGGGGGGARDAGTRARGDVAQARVDPRDGDVGVTIRIPGAVGRFCSGARREGSENGTAWKIKRNAFFIHDARGPRGKSHAENWCRVHTPRS